MAEPIHIQIYKEGQDVVISAHGEESDLLNLLISAMVSGKVIEPLLRKALFEYEKIKANKKNVN